MEKGVIKPSQLHKRLNEAKTAVERKEAMRDAFISGILAVIRRIPEILGPLSEEEKAMVLAWANRSTLTEEVSDRDFAFHFLVNCEVSPTDILRLLEKNRTFSRSALEHIQKMLQGSESAGQFNNYLRKTAEALIIEDLVSSRDRGRHILMTVAQTEEEWKALAERFSRSEFSDLRQRVLERFLEECLSRSALELFTENVVKTCMAKITAGTEKEVTYAHWALNCLERIGNKSELAVVARLIASHFPRIPASLHWRVHPFLHPQPKSRTDPFSFYGKFPLPPPPLPKVLMEKPTTIEQAKKEGWVESSRYRGGREIVYRKDSEFVTLPAQSR